VVKHHSIHILSLLCSLSTIITTNCREKGSKGFESPREHDVSDNHADTIYATEDDEDKEPVVFETASAQATIITPIVIKARGGLVNIPKRPPPPPLIRRTFLIHI
jgi:hypothetical protein